MRIIQGTKRPASPRRARLTMVALCLAALVVHFAVWSATASSAVRIVVDLILIAIMATATVIRFRAFFRADEEERKRNPKPW